MNVIKESFQDSTNFQAAWEYVARNYAYLIRDSFLRSITLVDDADYMPPMAAGLHRWFGDHALIAVRNGNHNIGHFVDILVHELTHLVQLSSGRAYGMTVQQLEREAYPAGHNARQLFELREFEEVAYAMKAATTQAAMRRAA